MTTVARLSDRIPDLAIHPRSLTTLLNVIDDPAVGADELMPVIEQDMGLTANLLRLCNSPIYNSRREIGSVREALVRIGNRAFARLAFVLGVEPVLNKGGAPLSNEEDSLWRHSLAVGWASAKLAAELGVPELSDRAYTAGILHDLGKAAYDGLAEDLGLTVMVTHEQERAVLGVDHAELAAQVVDRWGLPEAVVEMIRNHHEPRGEGRALAGCRAVHAADRLAHEAAGHYEEEEIAEFGIMLEEWGVGNDVVISIRERLSDIDTDVLALALGRG